MTEGGGGEGVSISYITSLSENVPVTYRIAVVVFFKGCIFRELNLKHFFTNSISQMIYLECADNSCPKSLGFKYSRIAAHSRYSRNMHPTKKPSM